REVAPPEPQPAPRPQPEKPLKELPSAPLPKVNTAPPEAQPNAPAPKVEAPKTPLKLEAPDAPQPQHSLILPKNSLNRSLQDTIRETAKNPNSGGRAGVYSGPMPHGGGGLNGGRSEERRVGKECRSGWAQ